MAALISPFLHILLSGQESEDEALGQWQKESAMTCFVKVMSCVLEYITKHNVSEESFRKNCATEFKHWLNKHKCNKSAPFNFVLKFITFMMF